VDSAKGQCWIPQATWYVSVRTEQHWVAMGHLMGVRAAISIGML